MWWGDAIQFLLFRSINSLGRQRNCHSRVGVNLPSCSAKSLDPHIRGDDRCLALPLGVLAQRSSNGIMRRGVRTVRAGLSLPASAGQFFCVAHQAVDDSRAGRGAGISVCPKNCGGGAANPHGQSIAVDRSGNPSAIPMRDRKSVV